MAGGRHTLPRRDLLYTEARAFHWPQMVRSVGGQQEGVVCVYVHMQVRWAVQTGHVKEPRRSSLVHGRSSCTSPKLCGGWVQCNPGLGWPDRPQPKCIRGAGVCATDKSFFSFPGLKHNVCSLAWQCTTLAHQGTALAQPSHAVHLGAATCTQAQDHSAYRCLAPPSPVFE